MLATIANHLWQSSLFAVIAALLAFALRKNGAHVRYWLWMTASLKFLVPFSVLVALGSQFAWRAELVAPDVLVKSLGSPNWAGLAGAVVQPVEGYVGTPTIQTGVADSKAFWSVELGVFFVWAAGFIGVLGFWTVRWIRMQALLRTAIPLAAEDPFFRDFPAPVKYVNSQFEPGIVGVLRPVLLFPNGLKERLTHQQLRAILTHERCHLDRRDNLTAAIHMLVEAVFWFHPFVWWIGARLVEERERACDAAVLNAGNDPETYAEGILDVCQHYVAAPECVAGVSGADLKKRVRAIMTHTGETRLQFAKYALLVGVALVMVGSPILIGAFTTFRAEAQTVEGAPAIASVSIMESHVDNPFSKSLLINPNGDFTTRNWTLRGVIGFAYGLQDSEIVEPTASASDIASARYNIRATAVTDPDNPITEAQFKLLAQRLLAEQFQLQFHWKTERAPVYALLADRSNPNIKPAKPGDPGPGLQLGVNSLTGHAVPMTLFNQYVARQLKRPVVDQTGLTARYNFTLSWGPSTHDFSAATPPPQDVPRDELLKAMEDQLGLTVVSQDSDVRKLVVDRLQRPAGLLQPPPEVKLSSENRNRFSGFYDFPPGRIVTITPTGEHLAAYMTAAPPMQIYATGERAFYSKDVGAELLFMTRNDGQVTDLVLTQNGVSYRMARLDPAEANRREAELAKRIREKIPQPGSETAVRKHLDGLNIDQPAYDMMTKEVQDAVRVSWAATKERYPTLGALKSIEFKSVGPTGADVYLATYENASTEWRVHLNADGKVDLLNYRRVSTK